MTRRTASSSAPSMAIDLQNFFGDFDVTTFADAAVPSTYTVRPRSE